MSVDFGPIRIIEGSPGWIWQMPGMSGLDAMIAIRNEFPDAKSIVLTTYTGDAQVLRAINRTPSCRYNVTGVCYIAMANCGARGNEWFTCPTQSECFRLFIVAFVGHKHCLRT